MLFSQLAVYIILIAALHPRPLRDAVPARAHRVHLLARDLVEQQFGRHRDRQHRQPAEARQQPRLRLWRGQGRLLQHRRQGTTCEEFRLKRLVLVR